MRLFLLLLALEASSATAFQPIIRPKKYFRRLNLVVKNVGNIKVGKCSNSNIFSLEAAVMRRREVMGSVTAAVTASIVWTISGNTNPVLAATVNQKTGIVFPSVGEIEGAIPSSWEEENPFDEGDSSFQRLDSKPDSIFYTEPRFVEHVDDNAVESMTRYISDILLRPGDDVLDLCSSWTSHIDLTSSPGSSLHRVAGLGMNQQELEANKALTEFVVRDLNVPPSSSALSESQNILPYEKESFDVVLCQLSIDYLTRPLEVMRDVARVLRPGGKVAIFFSNRLFITKVSFCFCVKRWFLDVFMKKFKRSCINDYIAYQRRWACGRGQTTLTMLTPSAPICTFAAGTLTTFWPKTFRPEKDGERTRLSRAILFMS